MIAHLRGREAALEPFGWTGRQAEWIALACLHSGVFIRAQWSRFLDAHPEQVRRGVHALIAQGAATEETVPGIKGIGRVCRIFSRQLYRALGAEDIRHRRSASEAVLMRRLLSLDYVLEHPGLPWLGGNPVLDLIAYHDPGLHTVIRVWYYAAPAVVVVLAGSVCLSVWRVWLQPPARGGGRGGLPAWPASPEDDAPSLVIGELHHPVVPRESERPSWLVVPEKGLYTGVLVVGAVGTGKTTACMYPFAEQLLSWQADRAGRRASALVLEVKGDFCHK